MLRAVTLAGLGFLCACNAILGLDPVAGGDDDVIDATPDGDGGGELIDAIDAANPDDLDGDGIPQGGDNCPTVANVNQDDDDGDGVGDLCDLCPMIADGGQATNADGDGIGDGCGDPDTSSLQCTVWYDGFGRTGTMARYASGLGHGSWSMDGGYLRQSDTAAPDGFLHLITPGFTAPLVIARITIDDRAVSVPLSDAWEAGVWSAISMPAAPTPDGLMGVMTEQGGGQFTAHVGLRRHQTGVPDQVTTTNTFRTMANGTQLRVLMDTRAAVVFMAVVFTDGTHLEAGLLASHPPGPIGLRTRFIAARFDYLLAIEDAGAMPCPPRVEP